MTGLVAAMIIALGQETSEKVSLVMPGGTVNQLAVKLAELTGEEFEISAELKGEVVSVSVKEMGLQEFLDKVGEATGGEWVRAGEKWRLVNHKRVVDAQDQRILAERVVKIREGKAQLAKFVSGNVPDELNGIDLETFDWEKATPEQRKLVGEFSQHKQYQTPQMRIWADLVMRVPDATLAAMEPGDRVVFSTKPTAMQKRISAGNWGTWLQSWIEDFNKQLDDSGSEGGDEGLGMLEELMGSGFAMPTKIVKAPSKANLVVSVPSTMFGRNWRTPMFSLDIYDVDGRRILQESRGLPSLNGEHGFDFDFESASPAASAALAAAEHAAAGALGTQEGVASGDMIKPSEKAVAFKKAFRQIMEDPRAKSDDVPAEALRPDLYEPLGYLTGDLLVQIAAKKGVQLVACLPDLADGAMGVTTGQTGDQILSRLSVNDVDVKLGTDVLVVSPKSFSRTRAVRMDRAGLAVLLNKSASGLVVPLDDLAAFAVMQPKLESNELFQAYLGGMIPSVAFQMMMGGMQNFDGVRFYGSLPVSERVRFLQGGQVNLGALTPGARGQLAKMVFQLSSPIVTVKDVQNQGMMQRIMMGGMMFGGGEMFGGTYESEPTELLPSGIPANGVMSVTTKTESYLMQVDEKNKAMGLSIPAGAEELAFFKTLFSTGATGDDINMNDFNRMVRGERVKIAISLRLRGEKGVFLELVDYKSPDLGKKYGMVSLPEDMKNEVAKYEKEIRDSFFGRMMRSGG